MLKHFDIRTPHRSHHLHNEHRTVKGIVERLKKGDDVALISDAGTPSISDPGFLLVRACIAEQIEVACLPGPTALIPALVISGLPTHRFHFEGFLPHKKGRQTRLKYLAQLEETMILYESPHRIKRTLLQLQEHISLDRPVCLCRELTKLHEEVIRGSLAEVKQWTEQQARIKGELVLVIGGLNR